MHAEGSIFRERFKFVESPVFEAYEFHQGVVSAKQESKKAARTSPLIEPEISPDRLQRNSQDKLLFQKTQLDSGARSDVIAEQLRCRSVNEVACDMQKGLLAPPSQRTIYLDRIDSTLRSGGEIFHSISLDGAMRLTAGGVFAAFIGRATENPLRSELGSLALRSPGSMWGSLRDLDRTRLQNLASWEHAAAGRGRVPGANVLLSKVQNRGAIRALGVIGCATAVNHVLDRSAFPGGHNGVSTSAFDVVGAGFIAGMPLRLPPVIGIPAKLAVIALGHQLTRRADASFFANLR